MHRVQLAGDIDNLASSVQRKNGSVVTAAACLVVLTENCLSRCAAASGSNVQPLLDLQREWMHSWLRDKAIDSIRVTDAVLDLKRAGETAHYLSLIPF